jgi:hypothetical protein
MGELENGGAYVAVRSSVCIDRRHNVIYLHCEISKWGINVCSERELQISASHMYERRVPNTCTDQNVFGNW